MTYAKLIEEQAEGFRRLFIAEIDLRDCTDNEIRRITEYLRKGSWNFTSNIADIIERNG